MPSDKPRKSQGARAKLRQHFLANIGRVMDSYELQDVAGGITEWARRVRELRTEEGYQILTHNDLAELKPGQYVLRDPKPIPAFTRAISKEIRALVLERNGYTCQMCGAGAGEPDPYDPARRVRLHIGHIIAKSAGGQDEMDNLRALCSSCNEGANNRTLPPPDAVKLLQIIRVASKKDQRVVLEYLKRKFDGGA